MPWLIEERSLKLLPRKFDYPTERIKVRQWEILIQIKATSSNNQIDLPLVLEIRTETETVSINSVILLKTDLRFRSFTFSRIPSRRTYYIFKIWNWDDRLQLTESADLDKPEAIWHIFNKRMFFPLQSIQIITTQFL